MVRVGVGSFVGKDVSVGVCDAVGSGLVTVTVGLSVRVGVAVAVGECVSVGVAVSTVAVNVSVAVSVGADDGVKVIVGVGEGVRVGGFSSRSACRSSGSKRSRNPKATIFV